MTPDQQVKEIVKLLNPENPSSTDAVFLVQKYITDSLARIQAKDKQIALLEAQLEVRLKEKHDVINEKLDSESRLKKEKEDLAKKVEEKERKPGSGGGRTL